MMSSQGSVIINRPIEQVFTFVTRLEYRTRWYGGTLEARQTSAGPVGIGTTFHEVFKVVLGTRGQWDPTVIEFEPNRRLGYRGDYGPTHVKDWLRFEPVEGGTRVTQTTDVQLGRFGIMEPLLKGSAQRAVMTNLTNLKTQLERS